MAPGLDEFDVLLEVVVSLVRVMSTRNQILPPMEYFCWQQMMFNCIAIHYHHLTEILLNGWKITAYHCSHCFCSNIKHSVLYTGVFYSFDSSDLQQKIKILSALPLHSFGVSFQYISPHHEVLCHFVSVICEFGVIHAQVFDCFVHCWPGQVSHWVYKLVDLQITCSSCLYFLTTL